MNAQRPIKTVSTLLSLSTVFLICGFVRVFMNIEGTKPKPQYFTPKDFGSAPRSEYKAPTPMPTPNPFLQDAIQFKAKGEDFPFTYEYFETEYISEYFVTAYSDEETWSRETASGVEVHYSDNHTNPPRWP